MMKILLTLWVITISTIVFACEDVSLSPKEFYTLAGREKCYIAYEQGCSCVINNDGRILEAKKGGTVESMSIAFQICSKTEPETCRVIIGKLENPTNTGGLPGWIITPVNIEQ